MINLGRTLDPNAVKDSGSNRIYYLDLRSIKENSLNICYENLNTEEDMKKLKDSIREVGLINPLEVRKDGKQKNRYVLLSGHRRFQALKELFAEGETVYFNQTTLKVGQCPAIILNNYSSDAEELRVIHASNLTRKYNNVEIREEVLNLKKMVDDLKEKGYRIPGRERDYIAEATGNKISGRQVQRILSSEKKTLAERNIEKVDAFIRFIRKYNPNEYEPEEIRKMLDKLNELTKELEEKSGTLAHFEE